jgi:hypothetical protein
MGTDPGRTRDGGGTDPVLSPRHVLSQLFAI